MSFDDDNQEPAQVFDNPAVIHETAKAKLFEVDAAAGRKRFWAPKKAIVEESGECVCIAPWCDIKYLDEDRGM